MREIAHQPQGYVIAAALAVAAVTPGVAAADPTCADMLGISVHAQHIVGERPLRKRLGRLLTSRFDLTQTEADHLAAGAVWRVVPSATRIEALVPGDGSLEWLIVSGRVRRDDDERSAIAAGAFLESGDVVRTLVVAGLDVSALEVISQRRTSIAVARALARGVTARDVSGAHVVAVVVAPNLDRRFVLSRLGDAMAEIGSVEMQWPHRIDALLASPGIAGCEPGEPGYLDVSDLIDQVEESTDYLLLETENEVTAWSRRCLETADRIAVVLRSDSDPATVAATLRVLDHAPPGTERTLVSIRRHDGRPSNSAQMIDKTGSNLVLHVDESRSSEWRRVGRTIAGRARGLVMGGGGARGFAHLGVFRALSELGVDVDFFGGSSIGASMASGIADCRDDWEDVVAERFANVLDYTVPMVALTSGRKIAEATEAEFGDREIEDLRLPYFCVSTNLTTADMFVHRRSSLTHAIRASCAIPGIMPPVPHEGDLLVDGGIANNLPIDVMRGYTPTGEIIACDVVPRRGPRAREGMGLSVTGSGAIRDRIRGRRTAPPVSVTLLRALAIGSWQRQRDLNIPNMADLLIDLDLNGVPMFAFDEARAIAQRGYEKAAPRIEAWLDKKREGVAGVVVDGS